MLHMFIITVKANSNGKNALILIILKLRKNFHDNTNCCYCFSTRMTSAHLVDLEYEYMNSWLY